MWWSASILMKTTSSSAEPLSAPFEENIVLIKAPDEAAAMEEAEKIGRQGEHHYTSVTKDDIVVRFDRVLSVYQILHEELTNGVELFSRFLRQSEAESLQIPFNDEEA